MRVFGMTDDSEHLSSEEIFYKMKVYQIGIPKCNKSFEFF